MFPSKGDSSEDFPNLVRFQTIESTNNEDQKSSISETSSDDDDRGCITWSRKETSNDKHLSSISDSTSELSSSDESSSSDSNGNDNEITKKRIKTKPKDLEDTDESVIFAENSTERVNDETRKPLEHAKTSQVIKTATTALKRKISENVDESEEIHNRQFIYIQVWLYLLYNIS
jgi:hypothetical protein